VPREIIKKLPQEQERASPAHSNAGARRRLRFPSEVLRREADAVNQVRELELHSIRVEDGILLQIQ